MKIAKNILNYTYAIASKELQSKDVEVYKTGKFTHQHLADAYCVYYKTIQNWLKTDINNEEQVQNESSSVAGGFSHNL